VTRSRLFTGLALLGAALGAGAGSAALDDAERAFRDWRTLADRCDVTEARGAATDLDGTLLVRLAERRDLARKAARAMLEAPIEPRAEDAAALAAMRETLGAPVTADADAAREALYATFGQAASKLPFEGETLDRLTILGRLAREADRERRRRLFFALAPVWRAVNGDGSATSPWRRLLPESARAWRERGSPADAGIRGLGVEPAAMEAWLLRLLEAWRDHVAVPGEPWDWWYAAGHASRTLSPAIPRERLRAINDAYHAALGAPPEAIGIRYDLDPRPGKTPVAFTTYGSRERPEAWVFATYAEGGFDNLVELLHETGHGLHVVATFAERPAFRDWPDSDPFTEGVGDLLAHEAYEPAWQRRWLGAEGTAADGIRARYAGVVLDVAWALFELRMHRAPEADPNAVWTEITSRYLKIAPHPELSWWALRGQLVEAPGYMANYAAGAFVTAALRARVRAVRGEGALRGDDPGLYPWLARELLRFGRSRPAAEVLRGFLGAPLDPEPLLADLARAHSSRD
jgi:hypothetical protein